MAPEVARATVARITLDPDLCNGRPTIRGKRIAGETTLEYLATGESREAILREYPSLEPADIDACLMLRGSPEVTADWRRWEGILAGTNALDDHQREHRAELERERLP